MSLFSIPILTSTAPAVRELPNDTPRLVLHEGGKFNRKPFQVSSSIEGALSSIVLTVLALGIHGYHPYAEDGGLYYSAVEKLLQPELFSAYPQPFSALMRHSAFPSLVSALVHISGIALPNVNFLLYLVCIWCTLFAGWLIAVRCYNSRPARYGAISLLAAWLTLPVAGTSLIFMDPYLTARSISTPCALFAIAAMLDFASAPRNNWLMHAPSGFACVLCVIVGGVVHPLMTGYAVWCLMLLFAVTRPQKAVRWWSVAAVCSMAFVLAACLFAFGPHAAPEYLQAARTRSYWFLSNWHWYEVVGLVAPLLLLAALARVHSSRTFEGARRLGQMAIGAGTTATLISLLFVHESSVSYELARLQPLRAFYLVYAVMILLLGAYAGERLLAVRPLVLRSVAAAALFVLLGAIMFCAQRSTFPASNHIEFPWIQPRNGWEDAFIWIRQNTPRRALFALDAHYITYPGEDTQYFSAIAQRSALPDYAKDGGLAAIAPRFAQDWATGQAVQTGLNNETDEQRLLALYPLSINWIVLPAKATTDLPCPFSNASAKVCRVVP